METKSSNMQTVLSSAKSDVDFKLLESCNEQD